MATAAWFAALHCRLPSNSLSSWATAIGSQLVDRWQIASCPVAAAKAAAIAAGASMRDTDWSEAAEAVVAAAVGAAAPLALAHLDCNLYSSNRMVLEYIQPHLVPGSVPHRPHFKQLSGKGGAVNPHGGC